MAEIKILRQQFATKLQYVAVKISSKQQENSFIIKIFKKVQYEIFSLKELLNLLRILKIIY